MVTHPAFNFVQQGLTSVNRLQLVILFGASGARLYSITHYIALICIVITTTRNHSGLFRFVLRLHALKNESFLRTCLQRQASRLQQAAVTYAVGRLTTTVTLDIALANCWWLKRHWVLKPCYGGYLSLVTLLDTKFSCLTCHRCRTTVFFETIFHLFYLRSLSPEIHIIRCIINVTKCPVRSITNCSQVTAETRDIVSDV